MGARFRVAAGSLALFILAEPATAAAADSYTGLKKTIAVSGFDAAETTGGAVTAEGLTGMLIAALVKDPHFVVVEWQQMSDVQGEQQAGVANNILAPGTAPKTGKIIGVGVLVRGTVTRYDPQSGGGGLSVGGPGLFGGIAGTVGLQHQVATVQISLRLIDMTTGQVFDVENASGSAASNGFSTDLYSRGGMEIGTSAFASTPLGKACEQAIGDAVQKIDRGMDRMPWSALVVETDGNEVYIDAGADQNMQSGTNLQVFRKVRTLTDPATGQPLETITAPGAMLRIREVHDKVSIADIVSGAVPARGDVVKLAR